MFANRVVSVATDGVDAAAVAAEVSVMEELMSCALSAGETANGPSRSPGQPDPAQQVLVIRYGTQSLHGPRTPTARSGGEAADAAVYTRFVNNGRASERACVSCLVDRVRCVAFVSVLQRGGSGQYDERYARLREVCRRQGTAMLRAEQLQVPSAVCVRVCVRVLCTYAGHGTSKGP